MREELWRTDEDDLAVEEAMTSLGDCFMNANRPCNEGCQAFNHDATEDPTENACTIVQGFREMSVFTTFLTEMTVLSYEERNIREKDSAEDR